MNVVLLDTDINPIQILLASDDYNHKLGTRDFVFILPDTIKATPHHQMRVALTSASIPVSFFNINNTNNRLEIIYENKRKTAVLPFGNYNMGQFLTATDTALKTIGLVNPIGMAWNSATNKVTFTVSTALEILPSSTCLKLLGFNQIKHSVNTTVNINEYNDTLVLSLGGPPFTHTLAHGDYDKIELMSELSRVINVDNFINHIQSNYNYVTDKITFRYYQEIKYKMYYDFGSTANQEIVFPEGRYTPESLKLTMMNKFNTVNGGVLNITYHAPSRKFVFHTTQHLVLKNQANHMLEFFGLNAYGSESSVLKVANDTINYTYDGVSYPEIVIPLGLHTRQELITYVESKFPQTVAVKITYDTTTQKYTFTAESVLVLQTASTALGLFGLSKQDYTSVDNGNNQHVIINATVLATDDLSLVVHPTMLYIIQPYSHIDNLVVQQTFKTLSILAGSNVLRTIGFTPIYNAERYDSVYTHNSSYEIEGDLTTAFRAENSLTSDSMCDIRGYDTLHFKTDLFTAGHTYNASSKKTSNNILAQIPVDAGAYQTIQYRPNNPHLVDIKKTIINTFRVWIEDGNGTLVDFNGMKWTATLTVYFMKTRGLIKGNTASRWGNTSYAGTGQGNNLNSLRLYIDEITKDYRRMGQTMKIEKSSLV